MYYHCKINNYRYIFYINYYQDKKHIYNNDPEYFGPSFSVVKFYDIVTAIKQQFVAPLRLFIHDYQSLTNVTNSSSVRKIMSMIKDVYDNPLYEYKPKKILLFCRNVESIERTVVNLKREYNNWKIFQLHYAMKHKDKYKQLTGFRKYKGKCIIVNCKMITDGIDERTIDGIAYVDPKYKKTDIIQSLSRPRSFDNKKVAYCFIPVQNDNDPEFETLFRVLDQLRNQNDPTVTKLLKSVCKRKPGMSASGKQIDDIIEDVSIDSNIKAVLYQHIKNKFKRVNTFNEAILKVLSDLVPRTSKQIWNEIKNSDLLQTDEETEEMCILTCIDMWKNRKINRYTNNYHEPEYYIVKRVHECHITLKKFLQEMNEQDVTTEQEYLQYIDNNPTKNYPDNPRDWEGQFSDFEWKDLFKPSETKWYELEQCKSVIAEILEDENNLKTMKEKRGVNHMMAFLHEIDPLIPNTVEDACIRYGLKKIIELNSSLRPLSRRAKR